MSEKTFRIDGITWNDLGMDEVCARLDTAQSSVGREYLKESLMTMQLSEKPLKERDSKADYLSGENHVKNDLKKIYKGLGVTKKVSFLDYIFKLEELKPQGNFVHYLLIALLLVSIAVIFIKPVAGIIAFVAMVAINISTYFAYRAGVEAYFNCLKYLVSMTVAAEKISRLKLAGTPFEDNAAELAGLSKTFGKVRRGSWLMTNSVSGSLADVVLDYVRMLFHVDIIKFNNMRAFVLENGDSVRRLYDILGECELCICISDYRDKLSGSEKNFCKPVFRETGAASVAAGHDNTDRGAPIISSGPGAAASAADHDDTQRASGDTFESRPGVDFKNLYHPLLGEPVANSLTSERPVLLTGSNASGKSTFLRSVAVNQIFAQTIYTVLADEFNTNFCKVISSMALSDNLLGNESYFVVEIKSLKRIFDNLGDVPVLCFVDEVLRGTNTKERIGASWSILSKLSGENAFVFAATHDIELTDILKDHMANYHFTETVKDNEVVFDYKLYEGPSTSRNAIKLLDKYGFDKDIVEEAERLAR